MTDSKKAWMVTSDYSVLAVFTGEASAKAYAEKMKAHAAVSGYDGADVEEVALDPELPVVPSGLFGWKVPMQADGSIASGWHLSRVDTFKVMSGEVGDRYYSRRYEVAVPGFGSELRPFWFFYMLARDEKHAVKIANERRAMLIASGKWEGV